MTFDLNKPYRTLGGHEAKVLGTMPDGRLCGWVKIDTGNVYSVDWNTSGALGDRQTHSLDLVNIPETRTVRVWMNVYPNNLGTPYPARGEAELFKRSDRIACIERDITFTVGEGLE